MMKLSELRLGIVGLGYVGLPLAVEFSRKFPVMGFDISTQRISELKAGKDNSLEVDPAELKKSNRLTLTDNANDLESCNVYIATVPTPIDEAKNPDLRPLVSASNMLGGLLKPGDIVIFESTVYPGATEEVCVPIIEQVSDLVHNSGFFTGYSPERINPGDREHRISSIKKVTSGSTPEVADFVDELYNTIVMAGTHKASSIRVAEAAKVIENIQRDVNIALINELAIIFNRMGIDTMEVLEAAGSKWNFLPFRPGLVGGHCIGVDPYYLTHKAQSIGYHPEIILAGRRINDSMSSYVSSQVIKLMIQNDNTVSGGRVLVLGLTFKENCPDLRNTPVADIVEEIASYGTRVDVYDPWISSKEAADSYGINPVNDLVPGSYDAVILAVAHQQFVDMGVQKIRALCTDRGILFDVKSVFPADQVDGRL
jgi:UDP-N-acetyl-D-galactosamine dehydrogenase